MKMYKNNWQGIIEVEVERKSESSVWIKGRRNAIRSSYENYFETAEECKAFMVREAEAVLKSAEGRVEYARKRVAEIMAIEPNIAVSGGSAATGETYTGRAGSQEDQR